MHSEKHFPQRSTSDVLHRTIVIYYIRDPEASFVIALKRSWTATDSNRESNLPFVKKKHFFANIMYSIPFCSQIFGTHLANISVLVLSAIGQKFKTLLWGGNIL